MIELPKHNEVCEKKPCGKGTCSMGWSLGVGIYLVDRTRALDWGTEEQIKCGCLQKVWGHEN